MREKPYGLIIIGLFGMHVSYINNESLLQYAIRLSRLLVYLEKSPMGSIGLVGIRPDDFVLVGENRNLKLVDLDDLTFEEKTCSSDSDCTIPTASELCK